jgi:hypothetical protein
MDGSRYNQELLALYQKHHDELKAGVKADNLPFSGVAGPFYSHVPKGYDEAAKRVLFIGQQTAGWYGVSPETEESVEAIQLKCREYLDTRNTKETSAPFNRTMRKWAKQITGEENNNFAYTNYQRFSFKNSKGEYREYPVFDSEKETCSLFHKLLKEEISILEPEILVAFLGNPKTSRYYLQPIIGNHDIAPVVFQEKTIGWETSIEKYRLFRTYHPAYLQRVGLLDSAINAFV